jgi:hypothetical protein
MSEGSAPRNDDGGILRRSDSPPALTRLHISSAPTIIAFPFGAFAPDRTNKAAAVDEVEISRIEEFETVRRTICVIALTSL